MFHLFLSTRSLKIPNFKTDGLEMPFYEFWSDKARPFLFQAYADLVKAFGWKSLVLLYENEESMIKLQEVLKYPRHVDTIRLTVRQLYTDTDDYRPLLKEIKTSGATKIVLDCAFNKIEKVLKQADEIGLISDYHSFLITSLDLERVDFSPYKRSNVNITGFRMIDPASPQVSHYLKKWNYRAGDGKGEFHPLYVRLCHGLLPCVLIVKF